MNSISPRPTEMGAPVEPEEPRSLEGQQSSVALQDRSVLLSRDVELMALAVIEVGRSRFALNRESAGNNG